MEDSVATRTSLLLSAAQDTLPFRMTESDLPTCLRRPRLHLFSAAVRRVC